MVIETHKFTEAARAGICTSLRTTFLSRNFLFFDTGIIEQPRYAFHGSTNAIHFSLFTINYSPCRRFQRLRYPVVLFPRFAPWATNITPPPEFIREVLESARRLTSGNSKKPVVITGTCSVPLTTASAHLSLVYTSSQPPLEDDISFVYLPILRIFQNIHRLLARSTPSCT